MRAMRLAGRVVEPAADQIAENPAAPGDSKRKHGGRAREHQPAELDDHPPPPGKHPKSFWSL